MIQPQPVRQRNADDRISVEARRQELRIKISILVFELVAHRGLRPTERHVVALVMKPRAVDMYEVDEETIRKVENRHIAAAIRQRVLIRSPMVVLVSREAVL